jgi:hypothetical protein
MLEDSLNAWGTPNGWDNVKAHLEDTLKQAKSLSEKDVPEEFAERSLSDLVTAVMNLHGGEDGRQAELELLNRLKRRKRNFTIQGPASLIYVEKGMLVLRTLKASDTFSGKFLAYSVGRRKKKNPDI